MAIADELSAVATALTKTQGDVSTLATGVTGLNTAVSMLTTEIANQGDVLSPTSQAALNALVTQATGLQTTADAAVAELPVPPAPPAAS